MRKLLVWGSVIVLMLTFMVGCEGNSQTVGEQSTADESVKLGIIQVAEHPALDAARHGFLETMAANGYEEGENLIVDYGNAQGDQTALQTIAKKLVTGGCDMILAIATDSAQAVAAETTEIPILFTAVTDPVTAKLVQSNEKPGTNATGTNDMNPVKDQIELLQRLAPQGKNIGVVYNAGEVNSVVQVDMVKQAATEAGLEVVEATVSNTSEVMQTAQSLIGRVDGIYIPTDNTVSSSVESVIKIAEGNALPVVVGEVGMVERGALATIGIDYNRLGKQTGEMAIRILKGEKPQDMAVEEQKDMELVLNMKAAEMMDVTIPEDLKKQAATIIE
ncbi:MAG: ABC transporter substrate-binding protein [Syntrophaceticus sp.]|jgi:putative ABC transport system substrate-binding protein|nr:ABC transporter substrate-binding protein [Syntrophaceticus sp.]MDD4783507.1 ABC transporter substrate-binding protein [Syntrophaceticus sp.]